MTLKSRAHVHAWPAFIQLIILNNTVSICKPGTQNEASDLDLNGHLNTWFSTNLCLPSLSSFRFYIVSLYLYVFLKILLCIYAYTHAFIDNVNTYINFNFIKRYHALCSLSQLTFKLNITLLRFFHITAFFMKCTFFI